MGALSNFGQAAAALDEAEAIAGERIGGPTDGDMARVALLEARVAALQPQGVADWRWVAERLARALANGWGGDATAPLVRLAL